MISTDARPRPAFREIFQRRHALPVVLFPDSDPARGSNRFLRRAVVAGLAVLALWLVWPRVRTTFALSDWTAPTAAPAPAPPRSEARRVGPPPPDLEPDPPLPEPKPTAAPPRRRPTPPPTARAVPSRTAPSRPAPPASSTLVAVVPGVDAPVVPGWLSISTTPWGLLFVDGRLVGNTPQLNVALSPGPRRLRIERAGFVPFDTTITVASGTTILLTRVTLTPEEP